MCMVRKDAREAALEAGQSAPARDHDGCGHDFRRAAHGARPGEGGEQNAPLGRAVIGGC